MKLIYSIPLIILFFIPVLSAQDVNGFILMEWDASGNNTYLISASDDDIKVTYENRNQGISRSKKISKRTFSDLLQSFGSLDLQKYYMPDRPAEDSDFTGHYLIAQMTLDNGGSKNGPSYLIPINDAPSSVISWVANYKDIVRGKQAEEDDSLKSYAAVRTAMTWLKLTDSEQYEASWNRTSSSTKSILNKDKWINMVSSQRRQLGQVKKRKLTSATYSTTMPTSAGTEGEYVAINFETDFSEKSGLTEMILSVKDTDNNWRVLEYYVVDLEQVRKNTRNE